MLNFLKNIIDRKKVCSICGQTAFFVLSEGTAKDRGAEKHYCREHFIAAVSEKLQNYRGKVAIIDRDRTSTNSSAQYFFYTPQDMKWDSYPEENIQEVERLLTSSLFDTERTDQFHCVKIPYSCKKPDFEDGPLFASDLTESKCEHLSKESLLSHIEEIARDFDLQQQHFQMNLPYGDRGLYIWHNYI